MRAPPRIYGGGGGAFCNGDNVRLGAIVLSVLLVFLFADPVMACQDKCGELGVIVPVRHKGIRFLCKLPECVTIEQLNLIIDTPGHDFAMGGKLHYLEYNEIQIYVLETWEGSTLRVEPVFIVIKNIWTQTHEYWRHSVCKNCGRLVIRRSNHEEWDRETGRWQWPELLLPHEPTGQTGGD